MIGRWTVLNGVLLLLAVLLGVQITRTWMQSVPPLRPAAPAAAEPRRELKPRPAPDDAATEEMVGLIASLDLFDQSRQASGAAGEATVAADIPPPTGIELVGIRLLGGDQEAFIRDQSKQNAQRRIRTGDEVSGYTVQAINATNVELANPNGQSVTLWLQLAPSNGQKPGAPARPVAAPAVQQAAPRPTAAGVQTRPVAPAVAGSPPAAAGSPPAASPDPRAAERQRLRQQRLRRQRGGAMRPNLPAGVRERLDEMRKGA